MSVYFITCREVEMVKIGTTTDIELRLQGLRCTSPLPLKLEALLPGDQMRERYYHDIFHASRKHGEWFQITPDIEEVIAEWPAEEQERENALTERQLKSGEAVAPHRPREQVAMALLQVKCERRLMLSDMAFPLRCRSKWLVQVIAAESDIGETAWRRAEAAWPELAEKLNGGGK